MSDPILAVDDVGCFERAEAVTDNSTLFAIKEFEMKIDSLKKANEMLQIQLNAERRINESISKVVSMMERATQYR